MLHPLQQDLSNLKDSEIELKISELSKKYLTAQRIGNHELLTQVQTFVTIYREEMARRYRETMKNSADAVQKGDLDQLVNVDK
jgi:hypothetical protein